MKIYVLVFIASSCLFADGENWPYGSIHTIGDSHSYFSFGTFGKPRGNDKNIFMYTQKGHTFAVPICKNRIGPKTMHAFGINQLKDEERKILDFGCGRMEKGDFVVFCFGEIDVRCHIAKQVQKNRKEEKIIDTLATNYISAVMRISKIYQINPVVMAVIPPVEYIKEEYKYAMQGSDEERIRYTKQLNHTLYKLCKEQKFLYLNVNDFYVNKKGLLKRECREQFCHISLKHNFHVKKTLCDLILSKTQKE